MKQVTAAQVISWARKAEWISATGEGVDDDKPLVTRDMADAYNSAMNPYGFQYVYPTPKPPASSRPGSQARKPQVAVKGRERIAKAGKPMVVKVYLLADQDDPDDIANAHAAIARFSRKCKEWSDLGVGAAGDDLDKLTDAIGD